MKEAVEQQQQQQQVVVAILKNIHMAWNLLHHFNFQNEIYEYLH